MIASPALQKLMPPFARTITAISAPGLKQPSRQVDRKEMLILGGQDLDRLENNSKRHVSADPVVAR